MSVTYREKASIPSRARKVGRKFASSSSSSASPELNPGASEAVTAPHTDALADSRSATPRTPEPSESLFSIGEFSINDVDQLRQLMHESLTSFAVEVGTQVASCLLEDDVVKLCGEKSQRVLNRANNRHGTQPGYVILGG